MRARLARTPARAPTKPADAAYDEGVRGIPPCSLHFEETGIRIRYAPHEPPPGAD